MDKDLRNSLWNVFYENVLANLGGPINTNKRYDAFFKKMWREFLKEPVDSMPTYPSTIGAQLKSSYFKEPLNLKGFEDVGIHSSNNWYQVYDFLEFVVENYPANSNKKFIRDCNYILERELSAYRFVGNCLVTITNEQEIAAVEQALQTKHDTHYANTHLETALKLFADKLNPDFRNVIKESISAVEAICTAITKANGQKTSTLGEALKVIEKKAHIELHPTLKVAFDKMYGYTSDGGIRHYIKDDEEVNVEDAQYMLVTCSAFVNYLTEKARKAEIEL
ncbi:hypothetical protein COK05_09025 [Bacillus cereus]|uniref:HEPN AbiJ-N-terminal domain-containing protein n=2 Tax=Bacillus cereus TaxID=1396 RepID=A0A2B2LYT9_BACCE|nr:hypothetical protein COK05_09025 [Bacillus cereus]